jgi:prephenate dehydrogenase
MKVTIIGLGLIGGSLGLDFKQNGLAQERLGVESSPENAQKALQLSLVDRVEDLGQAVPTSDLVILAIPVGAIIKTLPAVLDLAGAQTTVTDMGSTKERISEIALSHPKRAQFVASHPMAGTENSGPEAALKGLFRGKTAVLCDLDQSAPEHVGRVRKMYQALEMRLIEMSSKDHDLHAAYVSHLSHISSFVLANTVLQKEKDENRIFDLAGGGFDSTVRLAKSSPDMWAPIFEQNQANVLLALDAYIEQVRAFRASLVSKDPEACRSLMESANQIRHVLKKDDKNGK